MTTRVTVFHMMMAKGSVPDCCIVLELAKNSIHVYCDRVVDQRLEGHTGRFTNRYFHENRGLSLELCSIRLQLFAQLCIVKGNV